VGAPRHIATFEALLVEVREVMNEAPAGFGLAMAH